MTRTARARAAVAVVVTGLVLALAGCNDDSKSGPDTTSSPTTGGSPSATASTSPSADATPTIAPAAGPLLTMPNATINAPKGWKKLPDLVRTNTEANPRQGAGAVRLSALPIVGPELPLDEQAKAGLGFNGKLKRVGDVEIDGVTFYHLVGSLRSYTIMDIYGVDHDGYQTGIEFEFDKAMPKAERQQTMAEGLASFAWR